MSRPTREQIEVARAIAQEEYNHRKANGRGEGELLFALRVFLAATAEPTDEELAEEAGRVAARVIRGADTVLNAYIAGARREGAKAVEHPTPRPINVRCMADGCGWNCFASDDRCPNGHLLSRREGSK